MTTTGEGPSEQSRAATHRAQGVRSDAARQQAAMRDAGTRSGGRTGSGSASGGPELPRQPSSGGWKNWKTVVAGVAVVAGIALASLFSFDGEQGSNGAGGSDQLSQQEITQRQADFNAATVGQGVLVPVVAPGDVERAIQGMDITADQRQELRQNVEHGRVKLVALTFWDTHAEDGDVVEVSSESYRQVVPIKKAKTTVNLPAPASGVVNVSGVKDGGGGITIGIMSGSSPVNVPYMREGQTIGIPVSSAP